MAVRIIPAQQRHAGTGTQTNDAKLRVAAYARVSTDNEDQETSYEAQVRHYTDYITNHEGWVLVGVDADEGISGTSTAKREQFNKMIRACENGEVDLVITKSISRWARNTLDSLNYIRKLKALGIPVMFEKESINTMGTSGELLITIMSSLAQQESQSISQNVRIGLQYGFQQGKPMLCHTRFLGYTKKRGDKALTIVPEEAETVRMIFRDFLEGYSAGEIAKNLEELHIKAPGGGDNWEITTIKSMLGNEKFMGDLLLQKSYIEDFLTKKSVKNDGKFPQYYVENAHPPIVPKEVFLRVQGILLRQRHNLDVYGKKARITTQEALFGKLVCGECGARYRRYIDKRAKETKWRCRTRSQKRNSCDGRGVTEREVKGAVVTALNCLPQKREDLIRMQERILWGPLDRISRELEVVDHRKNELEECISEYAATGHLDRRTIFIYSEEGEEIDEETVIKRISDEIAGLNERRESLLWEKGDLGVQEANIQTLLKMTDAIMRIPAKVKATLKTGTDNETLEGEEGGKDPAACYDLADFYERTDRIRQWGPLKEYDNEMTKRYIDKVVVKQDGIEVCFKAGINVMIPA